MRRLWASSLSFRVVIVILLGTLGATNAWSQGFTGGLRGAVKDANGIIPGVQVILTNPATNVSRTTVTNGAGEYTFVAVPAGGYSVRATLDGYKTFEGKGLTIGTQQFITLDILLEVGGIQENVSVVGAAPLVETSNASLGDVLSSQTIAGLPSLTRNAFMMAAQSPTYLANVDPRQSRMQDQSGTSLVSLGGGLRGQNNYVIDGVPITDVQNRPALLPTMEAIEDIKVQVHTYDAEMGRTGGGVFNVTAKSGTNQFRGTGFYQTRPEWGMANNFFSARNGIPKPSGKIFFKAYGGGVGGPILKNKTFFWVATEGYRDSTASNGQLFLPTDLERNGNFSQTIDKSGSLVVIYDPLTTRPDGKGGYIRDPFPGNIIPANRINTVAKNITGYLDRAQQQRSGASGTFNYTADGLLANVADSVTGKVEHKFTDKWSLTGLYIYSRTDEPFPVYFTEHPEFDPGWNIVKRRPKVLALNNTYMLNPTTVMTLRAGWMSFPSITIPESEGFDMASLGFAPSYVSAVVAQKFPRVSVLDKGQAGGALIGDAGHALFQDNSYSFNGSVSKLIGRHTVKTGADFRHLRRIAGSLGQTAGTFIFDRGWTQSDPSAASRTDNGDGFASFLLGLPTANQSSVSSVPINIPTETFVRYYGGYAQDDWRISSKLSVNYGLRYEWESGLREVENRFLVAFDRAVVSPLAAQTGLDLHGGLRYAGKDGFPETQGNPSKKKFSPRVGVAWSLNPKTVVRGGYGLFWTPLFYNAIAALGYQQVTNIDQSNTLIPTVTLTNPFPTGLLQPVGSAMGLLTGVGGPITYNNQDRQSEYVQQYSVDFQRQLPGNMAVALGYIGTRGDQLNHGQININQLTPDVVAQWGAKLNDRLPNPFFGIAAAGAFSTSSTIARGQLLRPYPQFGNINQEYTTGARTRYHAVTARFEKRDSQGWWSGRFHYTWSKLDTNNWAEGNLYYTTVRQSRPLNNYDLEAEYSRSLQDVPHRAVLSPTLRLPFGEGRRWAKSGLANLLIGGWDLSVVAMYESGFPINVVAITDNTGSFGGTQRPIWTGVDPATPGSTTDRLNNYINPAAYTLAPAFTFGTGPRTDERVRTPFRTNYDVAIIKSTPVFGRVKAEIRLEMLNASNNPKFVGVETRLGTAQFGTITQQAGLMRTTQLMVRLRW